MLSCLRHWAIVCGNNQNRTIHLRRTSDHVFHIICMTGAIYMSIMTVLRIIFHVSNSNGNTALLFLRRFIDLIESNSFGKSFFRQNFCDRSGKSSLTMVNVTHGPNVHMRFIANKFFFSHADSLQYIVFIKLLISHWRRWILQSILLPLKQEQNHT